KPAGYVTTVSDPGGRRKVTDLLRGVRQRVYPVGRLDYDTEGLLLLTNDGELTYALTHPSQGIPKTYLARVRGVPSPDKLATLSRGVLLADGPTAPARVKLVDSGDGAGVLKITVHEGKNRQIRRMCEHIGHPVQHLRRVSVGPLQLDGLGPGQYRHLASREVSRLKKMAKL
ncbi:MAG: rRNA pseudouridine synthase, partial [Firmicutes bacterium]|nr:rRNA pseudouridine synthase [Bacillota bacterium]